MQAASCPTTHRHKIGPNRDDLRQAPVDGGVDWSAATKQRTGVRSGANVSALDVLWRRSFTNFSTVGFWVPSSKINSDNPMGADAGHKNIYFRAWLSGRSPLFRQNARASSRALFRASKT